MENFESIFNQAKRSLSNIGGIFDKEAVERKLKV